MMRSNYEVFFTGEKVGLLLLLFLLSGFSLNAQTAPVKKWDKTFTSSKNDDVPGNMWLTADGGCILGGITRSRNSRESGRWDADYLVIKLDVNGNQQWRKNFGGTSEDKLKIVRSTADGGYILGGNSSSSISGNKTQTRYGGDDYWVIKIDPIGNKQWERSLGGNGNEYLTALYQTSDGGYIVGGISNSDINGKTDPALKDNYWIVKLDSEGNTLWEKFIGDNSYKFYELALHLQPDGSFIISGSVSPTELNSTSLIETDFNFLLIKLDKNGNVLWNNTYGGSQYDFLKTMLLTPDGGYLLTGNSFSGATGDKSTLNKGMGDIWLLKLDSDGGKIWDKSIGSKLNDKVYFIQQTSDGGYAMLINSDRIKTGKEIWVMKRDGIFSKVKKRSRVGKGLWVLKMDDKGNIKWKKELGLKLIPRSSMEPNENGGVAFLVYRNSPRKKKGLVLLNITSKGRIDREIKFDYFDFGWLTNPEKMKFSLHFTTGGGFIIEGKEGINMIDHPYQIGDNFIFSFKLIKYSSDFR